MDDGRGSGSGDASFFFDLLLLPNTPLKIFNRKPFFSSLTLIMLVSLLTMVVLDPRDGGVTWIISFSTCGGVAGVAGTIESKVIPYS